MRAESLDQLALSSRIGFGRSKLITEALNARDVLEQLRRINPGELAYEIL